MSEQPINFTDCMNVTVNVPEPMTRERIWLQAWMAVATSESCKNIDVPARYADQCLADFDQRFPALSKSSLPVHRWATPNAGKPGQSDGVTI